ncbi:uncharacterized protein [Littorina saxatilis]|uniref:Uncharacterized protein n=1 Tax=Littorina saxatilis TaxID=31220 RepID=A0AAN9APE1_9CAEN
MASKILITLLLLVCSASLHVMSSPREADEQIIEESDVEDPEMGTIHDVREVDSLCRHEKNTNTMADGSNSTLLDDFEDGKGVVLISNSSDICLVRDIDQEERDQADTCKQGMVIRNKDKPDNEKRDYVKSDTELTEEEKDDLPEPLKAVCDGKQIYKMVPRPHNSDEAQEVSDSEDHTEGSLSREKRYVRLCIRAYYRFYCYTSCSWWSCCRRCRVVKYYRLYWCSYRYWF